jgi:ParB/RepB/Spo0J family partition protein
MANTKNLRDALLGRSKAAIDAGRSAAPGVADQSGAVWLPLAEIAPDPDQPRTHYDEAAMRQLCDSIRAVGQIEPILVQPLRAADRVDAPDRRFRCISGHRRLRAHELLGLTEIKATVVREELSPSERLMHEVAANEAREDHTDFDRARFMATLFANALGDAAPASEPARFEHVKRLINRAFNEHDRTGRFTAHSGELVTTFEEALKAVGERRNLRWFHRWGLPLLALKGAAREVAMDGLDARRALALAPLAGRDDAHVRRLATAARVHRVAHREFAAAVRRAVGLVESNSASPERVDRLLADLAGSDEETGMPAAPAGRRAGKSTEDAPAIAERVAALAARWSVRAPGARGKAIPLDALVAGLGERDRRALERFVDAVERADRLLAKLTDK